MKKEMQGSAPAGAFYGYGFVGTAVYFISNAIGFWISVLGFFLTCPPFLKNKILALQINQLQK